MTEGRFELDFELETVPSETVAGERAMIRWEGTIRRDGGAMHVRGQTREDHVWSDKWGGQGFSRGSGTFDGRLIGNAWHGTTKERGETKASQVDQPESYQLEAEWSIELSEAG